MFSMGEIAWARKFGIWSVAGLSKNSIVANPTGGMKKMSIPAITAAPDQATRERSSRRCSRSVMVPPSEASEVASIGSMGSTATERPAR